MQDTALPKELAAKYRRHSSPCLETSGAQRLVASGTRRWIHAGGLSTLKTLGEGGVSLHVGAGGCQEVQGQGQGQGWQGQGQGQGQGGREQ